MAAAEIRPPWFGNRGVPVIAAVATVYVLVRAVMALLDSDWAQAFLDVCWGVLFSYAALESLRFRKRQDARAADEAPADPPD
jgi:hypothetical protein